MRQYLLPRKSIIASMRTLIKSMLYLTMLDIFLPVTAVAMSPKAAMFQGLDANDFLMEVLTMLDTKHLVVITNNAEDAQQVTNSLWLPDITTEQHLHAAPFELEKLFVSWNETGAKEPPEENTTFKPKPSELYFAQWNFLYGRGSLFRKNMAVLVVGFAKWIQGTAPMMMEQGVFGRWDTLILLPTKGKLNGKELCNAIPVGVRVAALSMRHTNGQERSRCSGFLQEAKLFEGGRYSLKTVGCWRSGKLLMEEQFLPPITSLKGSTLKTAVVKGFKEVIFSKVNSKLMMSGHLGKLLTLIQDKIGFHLDVMEVEGYGTKGVNGSYSGVIGFAERRDIDFASASMSMLPERSLVVDYSCWFGIAATRFITKVPQVRDDQFLIFQVFHWKSWCAIGSFLVLASLVVSVVWKEAERTMKDRSIPVVLQYRMSTVFKAAVYMSSVRQPSNTAGRLVLMSAWLIIVVLVSTYNGNLTAFLSIPRVDKPPETVRQLLDMDYKLSISRGFSQYTKMKESPVLDYQAAFANAEFRQDSGIFPKEEYIRRVKSQPLALMVGEVRVCTLKTSSESLFIEIGALGFKRNSPIKHLFDEQILWLVSTKIRENSVSSCRDVDLRSSRLEPLGTDKLGGVLVFWACGISFSFIGFLVEIILVYCKIVKENNSKYS